MMTAPQLLANRTNALVSTGPRTADGKAVAARNATRHGCFAAVPVIANLGESQEDWDAHRAGVVDSLAPAGLMLPNETVEGKITRYESHLGRQLQQTLTQLERLQAVRAGIPVVPPLAVEVGVNVTTDGR